MLNIYPGINNMLGTAGDFEFMGMGCSMSTQQTKAESGKKVQLASMSLLQVLASLQSHRKVKK